MVDGRDGQALLDETLRLVDRAGWALSGQQMVTAATAEASVLSAATALRDVGAAAAGAPLAAAPLNPRADLAAATRLCQQLPADLAEHGAVLAAAAHLRQAERLLRGQ